MDEAVAAYQKVIERGPAASSEAREAEQHLKELGTHRRSQGRFRRGSLKRKPGSMRECEGGVGSLSESGGASSKSLSIRLFMGSLASQLGNPTKAEEVYREAIQIDSTALQPHLSLAKLYDQIGKTDEAIKEYEALLLLNHDETLPEIRSAKEALFLLLDRKEIQELTQRGEILTQEGKWGRPFNTFRRLRRSIPGFRSSITIWRGSTTRPIGPIWSFKR